MYYYFTGQTNSQQTNRRERKMITVPSTMVLTTVLLTLIACVGTHTTRGVIVVEAFVRPTINTITTTTKLREEGRKKWANSINADNDKVLLVIEFMASTSIDTIG